MTDGQTDSQSQRLIDLYRSYFEVELADTDALREEAFRLRYQVLVVEHPYLNPEDYPQGIERDDYDDHSDHALLVHRPSGAVAGTVRLIRPQGPPTGRGLPIQEVCKDPLIADPERFPVLKTGEISRFSVSKQFRRRLTDTRFPDAMDERVGGQPAKPADRRIMPFITLGLMQAMLRMSVNNGLTHVCASMERQLLRLLARISVQFHEVGPLVELHGWRQPCYRGIADLLNQTRTERPEVWDVITDDGAHWESFVALEGP